MKKLYIFCVPSLQNVRILQSLYLLLATGSKLGRNLDEEYAVRPIFIGQPESVNLHAIDELEQWRLFYERARNWRFFNAEARRCVFCTRILEAYIITNTKQQETDNSVQFIRGLFQNDVSTYSKGLEWEQDFRSNNPNIHVRITEQDSVIYLLPSDKPEQTITAKLLFEKKWVRKVEHTGLIIDLSNGGDELTENLLGYGLSLLRGVENQLFIPNTGSSYFSSLVAATSIIDFSIGQRTSGMVSLPCGLKSDDFCYYNFYDLPNDNVRKNLVHFHLLANLLEGKYLPEMREWQIRVDYGANVENDQLLSNNDLNPFIQLFRDWQLKVYEEFRFVKSDEYKQLILTGGSEVSLNNMLHCLNQTERINVRLNNAERKQVIILGIIKAAYTVFLIDEVSSSYYAEPPRLYTNYFRLLQAHWQQIPNPFSLFLSYLWAFCDGDNPNYLRQRSYCLDMWELFFRIGTKELKNYIDIEEILVKDVKEGHYWDVLNTYEEYRQLFGSDIGVCYIVRSKRSGHIIAYSSTYTGFCVRHDEIDYINLEDRVYFSPYSKDWHELKERDKDFRVFIQRYVSLMQSFSQEFKEYVYKSLTAEDHVIANSKHFLDAYERFRQHVAIK